MSIMISRFHLCLTLVVLILVTLALRGLDAPACIPNTDNGYRCTDVMDMDALVSSAHAVGHRNTPN